MENDIALMVSGYLLARLGLLAVFGYLIYRVLRPTPSKAPAQTQSNYATERLSAVRLDR